MSFGQLSIVRFKILSGATLSNVQDVRPFQIVAFQMTAWTAGTLSFKSRAGVPLADNSYASDALQPVYDDSGVAISLTVAANHYVVLTGDQLDAMLAVAHLQLVSQNAQGADTEVFAVVVGG